MAFSSEGGWAATSPERNQHPQDTVHCNMNFIDPLLNAKITVSSGTQMLRLTRAKREGCAISTVKALQLRPLTLSRQQLENDNITQF